MMTKSLPERLRDVANDVAYVDYPDGVVCKLCRAFGARCSDYDEEGCAPLCAMDAINRIAEEVELDYVPLPRFKSYESKRAFVDYMGHICEKADVLQTSCETNPDERIITLTIVCEPRPKDTLEAIEQDATLDPKAYCCEHCSGDISGWDGSEYEERKILDLLRRQREVLERDAVEREAGTCENTCTVHSGFTCSECGHKTMGKISYCPSCGAKVVKR